LMLEVKLFGQWIQCILK